MLLPVNANISSLFFLKCGWLLIWLNSQPLVGPCSEVSACSHMLKLTVGGRQQMPPNCRLAACFLCLCVHTNRNIHKSTYYMRHSFHLSFSASSASLSFCSNEKQMKSRLTVYEVSCAGLTEEISVHLDSLPNPLPQRLITRRDNARTHTSTHAHMKLSPRSHRGLQIQSNSFHRGVQAAAADRDQTREGEVGRNTI